MKTAVELFLTSIEWLKQNYSTFNFYMERDVVWSVQKYLIRLIANHELHYKVFNDYSILPGNRRSLSTDIAIVNTHGQVEVAVEFKYEPSHLRLDIDKKKFPVVSWDGVTKDIDRVRDFVSRDVSKVAYSILIDEGSYFRSRNTYSNSFWMDWGSSGNHNYQVSTLWYEARNQS